MITEDMVRAFIETFAGESYDHSAFPNPGEQGCICAQCERERGAATESIRRALTAALAAMWQPIETAPKDGTHILCYHPKYAMVLNGVWDGGADDCFELKDERLEYVKDFYPTHWMPLPPAPTQLSTRGSD